MKITDSLKPWFFACILSSSLPLAVFAADSGEMRTVSGVDKGNIFQRCAFEFSDTTHVSRLSKLSPGHDYRVSGYEDDCDIDLKLSGFQTLGGARVWISIMSPVKLGESAISKGFYQTVDKGWKFKGNPMGIYFRKYRRLAMTTVENANDTTLIGRQLESGKDQAGTIGTFEGVHLLRITPDYLVSIDLPFAYSTAPSIRDSVVADLTKVVREVRLTSQFQNPKAADSSDSTQGAGRPPHPRGTPRNVIERKIR
jgi:hypothetical protein